MFKRVKIYILFVLLMGAFVVLPNSAEAHCPGCGLYRFANVDAGWETMLIQNKDYEQFNHGFMMTFSGGLSIYYLFGLVLEQDVGFIDVQCADDSHKSEKLFKGGTFLAWPFLLPSEHLFLHAKIGIGALYMDTPEGSEKSVEAWFGFRTTLGIFFMADDSVNIDDVRGSEFKDRIGGGIEFGYSLGASKTNVFDQRSVVHFLSVKAKFVMFF